jgi:hypothetical protein
VIRHSHGLHGERKDDRYIERTIEAAHRSEPGDSARADNEDYDPANPGAWIAKQWNLEPPIVAGEAIGAGGAAIIYLTLADGRRLRFPNLNELFDLAAHVRQVSLIAESECPSLKKHEAILIAQRIRALCQASADPDEDREETQGWLNEFVRTLTFTAGELRGSAEDRWKALLAVRKGGPLGPVGIEDGAGYLWIPAEPFMRHVRLVEREKTTWSTLRSRMRELAWESERADARDPHAEEQKRARRIQVSFFVGTGPEGDDPD